MSDPVTTLRNLGPRCAEWLAAIGIHTAEDLRRIGAAAAYRELVTRGQVQPHRLSPERKRELEDEAGVPHGSKHRFR